MKHLPGILAGFAVGVGVALLAILLFLAPRDETVTFSEPLDLSIPKPGKPGTSIPFSSAGAENTETPPADQRKTQAESSPPEVREPASTPSSVANPAYIRGKVVFGAGATPVAGVPIRLSREGCLHSECLTDGGGRFAAAVWKEGTWKVSAFPYGDGGFRPEREVKVEEGKDAFVELSVPDWMRFDVSGRITDREGEPIPGVTVKVRGVGLIGFEEAEIIETFTGSGGAYAVNGVEIGFPRPSAATPLSMAAFDAEDLLSTRNWASTGPVPRLFMDFRHSDYRGRSECIDLSRATGCRITFDAELEPGKPAGFVSGTVVAPGREPLDGKTLGGWIEHDGGWSAVSGKIAGKKFRIRIEGKGRLFLRGPVGRYWIEKTDLGIVDVTTRKEGVVVKAGAVPIHTVILADRDGDPLPVFSDRIQAWLELEKGDPYPLEVTDGRVHLPMSFGDGVVLLIEGEGIVDKKVEIRADSRLPDSIRVEVLRPLMTGRMVFPPGFDAYDRMHVSISRESPEGGSLGRRWGPFFCEEWPATSAADFNAETGEFELKRRENEYRDAVYMVTITIPGYMPWIKKNIRLKKDETLESVQVTFKK